MLILQRRWLSKMLRLFSLLVFAIALGRPAIADVPGVITDIAPVHSLAAMVMGDLGKPEILLPPGASPHNFALRPSAARNLSNADIVIWIGADFTPWLSRPLQALAPDATSLELIEVPTTFTLPYRHEVIFNTASGGHSDAHDDDHHHAQSDAHDDDKDEASHSDHAETSNEDSHADSQGHAHHGDVELHAWQDPENAKVWLDAIADTLSKADPSNAKRYRSNAMAGIREIDAVAQQLAVNLEPLRNRGYVVMHDAYQYFEHRFSVPASAALLPGDGSPASAARVQAISRLLSNLGPSCIFVEPQMSGTLARNLAAEHDVSIGLIDPIGDMLERGPDQYTAMLLGIGQSLLDCLS